MILETLDSLGRNVPVSGQAGLPVKQAQAVQCEAGQTYIGGAVVSPTGTPTTDRAVLCLTNPNASGKIIRINRIRIWSTIAQQFQFITTPTTVNTPTARTKRALNGIPAVASVATLQSAGVPVTGGTVWENELRCPAEGEREQDFGDDEFTFTLAANSSLAIQGTSGAAQTVNYEIVWTEL